MSSAVSYRGSVVDRIGRTPLLRLRRLTEGLPDAVEVYIKAEWFNPGGSVKDRPVRRMLDDAERDGRLAPGKTILDSTSGNAGIAYAMIGAVKGYRVELVMPASASEERKRIIAAYGASITLSDPLEGSDGAILLAREIYAANPERYFKPDQYNNPSNWLAHYDTTAHEIWEQTEGRVTHLVAGLGTSGTLMGTARRLREFNPRLHVTSIQPEGPLHGIEGLKHMPTAIVPGIYDPELADEEAGVSTEDAYEMTRRLARKHGLLGGVSSGAAALVAARVASRNPGAVVVTIFPDGGARYLSEPFWSEPS